MRYKLIDFQVLATNDVMKSLKRASRSLEKDPDDLWSVALSAPTGAGKTVIAAAVIEAIFDGNEDYAEDPEARILWVTDNPALNEQTKRKMLEASSTLGPGRLTTIDAGFDQETFDPRQVYFLNIQKLAKSNPLSKSQVNKRTFSLWETISNTIDAFGAHFYVIVDEAHRGMKVETDRKSIVSKIINGQDEYGYLPSPMVWGISATPDRFVQAIERWGEQRTNTPVDVPIDDVRASGLLKDVIVLDNPAIGQIEGDTTFARGAVVQTLVFEEHWRAYTTAENEPPVLPVLVVQVQNTPSDAVLTELLAAIFGAWEGLTDGNVINTFGEHTAISAGGHTIAYMTPQDIQDDNGIRVVLCKDAISTGWDCPRAEVLVSMRVADDYTYIAQLIGRMVRTPLTRRITTDQTLNEVHCYLPKFNKEEVEGIVKKFGEGKGDEPPVEIISNPVLVERNNAVPDEIFEMLEALPTYVVPGKVYRTQIARLRSLATLLSGDNIVEDAQSHTQIILNGVLDSQRKKLETDGTFAADLGRIRTLRIERSYALLAAESMDDLPAEESQSMERDDNNIEDLFRVAKRKLPEGVASYYWNEVISAQSDDEYDPVEAKAVTAVLALHPEVVEAVENAASHQTEAWLKEHDFSIKKLSDAKKAQYEPIRRETREPQLTDLILPSAKTVPDTRRWPLHFLAAQDGTYPATVKGWEVKTLEIELRDKDLLGWYRNPTGGPGALRVPYRAGRFDKSMYPDFVMFHRTDEGIRPSIIDPHGFYLGDAGNKLKGLVVYAERHGDIFARIDAVAEVDGALLTLDLKSASTREAVTRLVDNDVEDLFRTYGGSYV